MPRSRDEDNRSIKPSIQQRQILVSFPISNSYWQSEEEYCRNQKKIQEPVNIWGSGGSHYQTNLNFTVCNRCDLLSPQQQDQTLQKLINQYPTLVFLLSNPPKRLQLDLLSLFMSPVHIPGILTYTSSQRRFGVRQTLYVRCLVCTSKNTEYVVATPVQCGQRSGQIVSAKFLLRLNHTPTCRLNSYLFGLGRPIQTSVSAQRERKQCIISPFHAPLCAELRTEIMQISRREKRWGHNSFLLGG